MNFLRSITKNSWLMEIYCKRNDMPKPTFKYYLLKDVCYSDGWRVQFRYIGVLVEL